MPSGIFCYFKCQKSVITILPIFQRCPTYQWMQWLLDWWSHLAEDESHTPQNPQQLCALHYCLPGLRGKKKKKTFIVFDTKDKWTQYRDGKSCFQLQFCSFHFCYRRSFRHLLLPKNQPNLFSQTRQFQHQYYLSYRLSTIYLFKGTKAWNKTRMFIGQEHKCTRTCKHF